MIVGYNGRTGTGADTPGRHFHYAARGRGSAMAGQRIRQCEKCGQEFHTLCRPGRPRRYCQSCKPGYIPVDRTNEEQVCASCGEVFHYHRKKKYCSRYCANVAHGHARPPTSPIGESRLCENCGCAFTMKASNQIACSDKCRARLYRCSEAGKAAQAKRNAFKRAITRYSPDADKIDVWAVFEHDGWRCQICGKHTPKNRRSTNYSNAPELDHRVPLSRGGRHTYANVQCACRDCNRSKGNRSSIGQLPLIVI